MLTTIAAVKQLLRLEAGTNTIAFTNYTPDDDNYIIHLIRQVSSTLQSDRFINRHFAPVYQTNYYDAISAKHNGNIIRNSLLLWDDLLELEAVTIGDTAIDLTEIISLPRGNRTITELLRNNGWLYSSQPYGAIAINGVWGFHHFPSEGWKNTTDTLQALMDTTATTLAVADADGVGWDGSVRFNPGMLIKIDSEYLLVNSVNITTNQLTVMRSQNGTLAATHSVGTPIYVWNPVPEAKDFVTKCVALNYRRGGAFANKTVEGMSEIVWQNAISLTEYRRVLTLRRVGKVGVV